MKESELLTEILVAIGKTVKEAGNAGIPSGHVYARLMGIVSLDQYNQILALMVNAGVIENKNHLLKCKATHRKNRTVETFTNAEKPAISDKIGSTVRTEGGRGMDRNPLKQREGGQNEK